MTEPATALIVVDLQPDFMPGGGLAVAGGEELVEPIGALLRSDRFDVCVATQDWHPAGHISFASSHEGGRPFEQIELYGHPQTLWPDHCIQGSAGARLHPELPLDRLRAIFRKGADPHVDSYSGFRDNWNQAGERPPTGLGGYLRERGVERVVLCGLARDVCLKWTAEDAAEQGFETVVLWDLSRPVDEGADERVRSDLETAGVTVTTRDEFLRDRRQ
jgi:nicotinamidase/pyrazinamidase